MSDMNSDKEEKEKVKLEKKRVKALLKAEKARAKTVETAKGEGKPTSQPTEVKVVMPAPEKIPWYKDPGWLRAIAAIATLIVLALTLIVTVL